MENCNFNFENARNGLLKALYIGLQTAVENWSPDSPGCPAHVPWKLGWQ